MKKIRYDSDSGYSIELGGEPPFILTGFDGNGVTGEANSVKAPGADGKTTYDLTRSGRSIELEGAVISAGNRNKWLKQAIAENRDYVARCFDPGYSGMLYYYAYDGDKGKMIRCRPTGIPAFEADFNNLTQFKLSFNSDGAVWEKTDALTTTLGVTRNNWRFPYVMIPSAFACIYAKAVIDNPTMYNLYPVVIVYNSDIPVEIENATTGKFLKFKCPTGDSNRLVADIKNVTAVLEEKVNGGWAYRQNVIHYLTKDSSFGEFVIVPGENEFKIKALSAQSAPILNISTHEPVMGV